MDPRLTSPAAILEQNNVLLRLILRGLSDQHLRTPAIPETSSLAWLLGHLAGSRYLSCKVLRGNVSFPHADLFARGSHVDDPATLPSAAELSDLWTTGGGHLLELMDTAGAELLAAARPDKVPSTDKTVLGAINFLTLHECYHLGQMGLIRKAHGYPGIAG